jgi:ARG and Rhodanese-Phosphatase-superfamily-associated Protein domain
MPITLPAQLDEPTVHRGITVVPLYPRRDPEAAYATLADGLRRGLRVTETGPDGTVPELVVENPLAERVLLYDGEELVGAKQNRILNLTVLVAPRSRTPIPVSCVEVGRWRMRSSAFTAAAHTAGPELRLRKARALGADALVRGVAQHEVWQAIDEQSHRRGVASPTGAHADLFSHHEAALRELRDAFPSRPGQCGVILVLPDGHTCLDYLSRPDAYAEHHRKLLDGYLMDALDQLDRPAAGIEPVNRMLHRLSLVPLSRRRSAGLGTDLRAATKLVAATGLELDAELLQLSAYA